MKIKELSERQARWKILLSQYSFRIEYRPGKEGGKQDALTRRAGDLPRAGDKPLTRNFGALLPRECWDIPEGEEMKIEKMELAENQDKNKEMIQQAYKMDNEIQAIKDNSARGVKEMNGIVLGPCQWEDEHLWYQGKIWIPNDEGGKTTLIRKCQDNLSAGHGGTAKTTKLVSRQYYSPGIRETIKRYVKNRIMCQRSKVVRRALYGMLQPNEVPGQPWKSIAMDFITDLPNSDRYDTILVVIHRLTKMSQFIPCKEDLDARQFATLFLKEIIRLRGIPRDIITDRGSLFTSELS